MRRPLVLVALLATLPACSFVDDFSRFHTDAGPDAARDATLGDGAASDLGHVLTPSEFVAAFTPIACAHALYCEGKLGLGALIEVYCHQELTTALIANGSAAGMPVGDVVFDPAAAQQCLDDLATALAAGMDCSVSNTPFPASCDHVAHGARSDGMHCVANAQCASGLCNTTDTCGGTCAEPGGPGTTCARNEQCQPSLRCNGGVCAPTGVAHDPCTQSDQCGTSLWCSSVSHTCEALPDSGAACESTAGGDPCRGMLTCTGMSGARTCLDGVMADGACDGDHPCQPGLRCSDSTHVCKTLSAPGGSCLSAENCPYFFVCTSGHCNAQPLLGEACDPLRPCLQGACVGPSGSTTCTLLPDGAMCTMPDDACQGYCDTTMSRCVPRLVAGAMCASDRQCATGSACLVGTGSLQCMVCPG